MEDFEHLLNFVRPKKPYDPGWVRLDPMILEDERALYVSHDPAYDAPRLRFGKTGMGERLTEAEAAKLATLLAAYKKGAQ